MEEGQISLNKDFKTAATALSQMYKEAVQQHRSGFNSGVRHASEQLCHFILQNAFYVDTKNEQEDKQRVISADRLCHFLSELNGSLGTESSSSFQSLNENNQQQFDSENNSLYSKSKEQLSTEVQPQPMNGKEDSDDDNEDNDDDNESVSEDNNFNISNENNNNSTSISMHNINHNYNNNINHNNGDQETQDLSEQMNRSFSSSSHKYMNNNHNFNENNYDNNNQQHNDNFNNTFSSYTRNTSSEKNEEEGMNDSFKSFSFPFHDSSPFGSLSSSRSQNNNSLFKFSPNSSNQGSGNKQRRKRQSGIGSPVLGQFLNEEPFKNGKKRSFVFHSNLNNEPPTKRKRFMASLLKQ